jgi:hypothetical protein
MMKKKVIHLLLYDRWGLIRVAFMSEFETVLLQLTKKGGFLLAKTPKGVDQ